MAAGLSLDHPWAFTFGILGNVISFMVYLSPLPTFYRVYKKKSTEGFQSVPYVVALFSATLWILYALCKADAALLITINSVGCVIETSYVLFYFAYAPRQAKIYTAKLVLLVNVGLFGCVLLLALLLPVGGRRVEILGWICVGISVSVFVAPLSIIRQVIKTKSVEFMPFWLSFFLTLSAVVWFAYGLLIKDIHVAVPNVLGFIFGTLQMILYIAYRDAKRTAVAVDVEHKLQRSEHVISMAAATAVGGEEKASETRTNGPAADSGSGQVEKGEEGENIGEGRTEVVDVGSA